MTTKDAQEFLGISKAKMSRMLERHILESQVDPLDARIKYVRRADVEHIKAQSDELRKTAA